MTGLSTHVLDAVSGAPAVGMSVILRDVDGEQLASGTTNSDGRIPQVNTDPLAPGTYHLVFATADWFGANGIVGFYPQIDICFTVDDPNRHYHVPVLLSPYSYSTYRGS
ncbi:MULTISPECIES: hydroxyisourate hydrolase [Gordonia]|uniref:hydroxyisourate hydrolase n=1 Tax=Gordonia TaxID=2053 RepID=UPI0007EB9790|nr:MULTISPECIES: hydroxyisourate hydrolase [Gordonia]MCM3898003.1 hydroxyisourate hydrolase [Gordonia sputi]OBA33945.1 hydroxyisourate hydrolase [Gordonia sp. 852002-51296_SCH5728562-b]OBA72952.1 hydroxyisourate hydrolase [Gordonia sp. 852002-10350_SCH5691597]